MARPRRAHRGQSIVEYSLIIAFVCIGCIAAIGYFQQGVATAYEAQQASLAEPTFSTASYIPPPTSTLTPTPTQVIIPTPTRTPVTPSPTVPATASPTVPAATFTATVRPPTATTVPVPTSTATAVPTATATATSVPTATATTVPTATATTNTGTRVTVTARLNTAPSNNQNSQYWVQVNNIGTSNISNLTARIYLNLTEVIAAGYSANNIVVDEYWDECKTGSLSNAITWDAARRLYYIQITWTNQTFAANDGCQIQFGIHLAGWQSVWNGTNDPSQAGLGTGGMVTTTAIPVYRNGNLIYGNEP